MKYKYKINYKSIGGSSFTSSSATLNSSTSSFSTSSQLTKKNVLFVCTTLDKDSTLSRDFVEINNLVRSNLDDELQAYFVYKIPSKFNNKNNFNKSIEKLENEYLKETLIENNYFIAGNPININFVDFLKENDNLKFDKIILAQCNEIVSTITGHEINPTYSLILENLKNIYNSLNDDGCIINLGYDDDGKSKLVNFEDNVTKNTIYKYPYYLFILKLLPYFFIKINEGTYRKNSEQNLNFEIIKNNFNEIKNLVEYPDYESINNLFGEYFIEYNNKNIDWIQQLSSGVWSTLISENEEIRNIIKP